jgi:hypothetical protein
VIGELLAFVGLVAIVATVGIVVGMLVAPRIGRMGERISEAKDEDAGDGTD